MSNTFCEKQLYFSKYSRSRGEWRSSASALTESPRPAPLLLRLSWRTAASGRLRAMLGDVQGEKADSWLSITATVFSTVQSPCEGLRSLQAKTTR